MNAVKLSPAPWLALLLVGLLGGCQRGSEGTTPAEAPPIDPAQPEAGAEGDATPDSAPLPRVQHIGPPSSQTPSTTVDREALQRRLQEALREREHGGLRLEAGTPGTTELRPAGPRPAVAPGDRAERLELRLQNNRLTPAGEGGERLRLRQATQRSGEGAATPPAEAP